MIYDVHGNSIHAPCDVAGDYVDSAYDIDGEVIFPTLALKVMTYNVGGWYIGSGRNVPAAEEQLYYQLQTGMIEDNDPDVLVIQEYLAQFSDSGTSAYTILSDLFPYVVAQTNGTYYGRAICSKYPITDYTIRTYTDESRYYDSCIITVDDIPVTFVNTHLGLTQAARSQEISELITYLNTLTRFVACGDYNTAITDADLTPTSSEYIGNVKPFINAGFRTANFGKNGFLLTCIDRVDGTHYYLDNIYTSQNVGIVSAEVDTTKMTDLIDEPIDHMPLIANLVI